MNQGSEDDETIGDGIDKLTAINENCGEHYETNYSGDKPAVDEDVGSEDDEDESHPGGTNQGSDEDETKDDEESYDNDDDLGDSVVEDSSSDDDTVGRDNSFLPTDKVNADDAEDIQDDGPLLSFDGKTVTLKPAPRIETRMVYTNGFNVTHTDTMRAHVESRKRKKSCNYTPSYQLTWLLMRMGRRPKPHFYNDMLNTCLVMAQEIEVALPVYMQLRGWKLNRSGSIEYRNSVASYKSLRA